MKEKVAREALSSRITHQQETYSFVCFFFKDLFPPYQVFFPIVFNDSAHLLLLSQLWPFPNHRWFFFRVCPSSSSPKPQATPSPKWVGRGLWGLFTLLFLLFLLFPHNPHSHCWEKSLEIFSHLYREKPLLVCLGRGSCFIFCFLKKKKKPSA